MQVQNYYFCFSEVIKFARYLVCYWETVACGKKIQEIKLLK